MAEEQEDEGPSIDEVKEDIEKFKDKKEDTEAHSLDEETRQALVEQAKKELKEEMEAEKEEEEKEELKEKLEEKDKKIEEIEKKNEEFQDFVTDKLDKLSESKGIVNANNPDNTSKSVDEMGPDEIREVEDEHEQVFFEDTSKPIKERSN